MDMDRSTNTPAIAISRFKATCLEVIERVRRTGQPIVITRHGTPVARLVPPPVEPRPDSWLGAMKDRGKIVGDVVAPAVDPQEWAALSDPESPT